MKRVFITTLVILSSISLHALDFAEFMYNFSGYSSDKELHTGLTVFPTLLIPAGGKYEAMGTAFTAVASDSGFIDANPSASSVLDQTELSFLHNDWISDINLEGIVYTMRFDNFGLGIGGKFLYGPFTEWDGWGDSASKGYYSESVLTLNASYNFFSSYDFFGFAVGANAKVAYRNIPEEIYAGQSAFTALVDLGMLTRLNFLKFYASRSRNFSLGLALRNVGPPVLDEPLPTTLTAGIAYAPVRPITLSYDLTIPATLAANIPFEGITMAGGIDVRFTDFFSILGGFLLKGYNPRISLGAAVDLPTVSFTINYTLDMTSTKVLFDRFSVEAKLNLGDEGRIARRMRVDEYYLKGIELYASGDIEEAIESWEKALELDPTYTPASEFIEEALRQQENKKLLESIR